MSISYEGPPQYSMHYSATVNGQTPTASSLTLSTLLADNDPGVFVIPRGYSGSSYLINGGNASKAYTYGDAPACGYASGKYINDRSTIITGGLVNMANQVSCYHIAMGQTTTLTRGGRNIAEIGIDIFHDGITPANRIASTLFGNCGICAFISDPIGNVRKISFDVERTEFGWNNNQSYHHTGVIGFTVYSQVDINGGIRLPSDYGPFETISQYTQANNMATKSLIFCRIIPTDGSLKGIPTTGYPNNCQCENAFVVFDGLCDFVLGNSTDSTAVGEPITKLVPSFDADQIKSNTGMLAVAMMAKGATKAYYLGYKNGVYKLYNGSQPYIMPPGSVVNIGKIKFQSIAYSSYFVRMN